MKFQRVGLLLVFIALGALGCLLPTPIAAPTASSDPTSTVAQAEVATDTVPASPDPTETWKVYANEEAGISFRYPEEWVLEETRTSAPLEGWQVSGPDFEVYTNFLGGFEEYEILERTSITLKSGDEAKREVYAGVTYGSGDEVELTSERLVLVHVPTMGPYGLIIYRFDEATNPEGLAVIEEILASFEIH